MVEAFCWFTGDIKGGSAIGVILLAATILAGPYVAANPALASVFTFTKHQLAVFIPIYGFIASALPVWLLLCPRDYLSTYLKLGTIAALTIGIFVVHPQMNMAAVTKYVHGGGPVIPGALFPFLFITIACETLQGRPGGAVSLAVGMAYLFSSIPVHEPSHGLLVPFCHHV